jgi:cytochrome P450
LHSMSDSAPDVLFAFSGEAWARVGMGSELYRDEPVFHASVDACLSEVEEALAGEALASFRGRDAERLSPEAEYVAVAALQIAQTDLWASAGVRPAATLGISLGEVCAAYAAGALSRGDAMRVAAALARACPRETTPFTMFEVAAGSEEAKRLVRTSPVALTFLGALSPRTSLLAGATEDAERAGDHLRPRVAIESERETTRGEHLPRTAAVRRALLGALEEIEPIAPAASPIYLASLGADASRQVLDGVFWHWMIGHPFYLDEAASAALYAGHRLCVGLGPRPGMRPWLTATAEASGRPLDLVASMDVDRPESETWREALASVTRPRPRAPLAGVRRWLRSARSRARSTDPGAPPRIVDTHDVARTVLTTPAVFSSKPWGDVDGTVLSVDSPEHDAPRHALRLLLSAEETARLAGLAWGVARDLLEPQVASHEFDLMGTVATPLTERVVGSLFGLAGPSLEAFAEGARDGRCEADMALVDPALRQIPEVPSAVGQLTSAPGLDEGDARSLVRLLWVAGTISTRRSIGAAVLVLDGSPELREQAAGDEKMLGRLIDEVIRLHPPEPILRRVAVEPTDLGRGEVAAGERIDIAVREVNRDPAVFPDPEKVDLSRPARHLSFGAGPHRCPGARLARAETVAAVGALLEVMPGFRVLQPRAALRYIGQAGRALEELVVAPSG